MNINESPRSLLCLRKMARKLWREPALQRKWLRAYLRARGWGGLVIEGAPGWHLRGRRHDHLQRQVMP